MSTKSRESELTWRDMPVGCIVSKPGNAAVYKTGDWRSQRAVTDKERCIKCGICFLYCPEGCVSQHSEGYFEADLYYCKGCGICARECWTQAIEMVPEE